MFSGEHTAYMLYFPKQRLLHEFRAGPSMQDRIDYSLPEPLQSRL